MASVSKPCCVRCGSHSFTFTPIQGPAAFVSERDAAFNTLEEWTRSVLQDFEQWKKAKNQERDDWNAAETKKVQDWFTLEMQSLELWFKSELSIIEEQYQQELRRIEDSFDTEDPFNVLYDSPEEARTKTIQLAEATRKKGRETLAANTQRKKEHLKDQAQRKQAAVDAETSNAHARIEKQILRKQEAVMQTIDSKKKTVEEQYRFRSQNTLLLIHCDSCGHIFGSTSPPNDELCLAFSALHDDIRSLTETMKAFVDSLRRAADSRSRDVQREPAVVGTLSP